MIISSKPFILPFGKPFLKAFGDQAAGLVGATVFDDTFNHDIGSDLVGTTHDTTGTSWLSLFNDSTTTINAVTGALMQAPATSAGGILIHSNYGTVNSADVDIIGDMTELSTNGSHSSWMVGRYIDGNNFIALAMEQVANGLELFKVVGGVATSLGTSSTNPGDGKEIKLQLRNSAWKVLIDDVGSISVTESDLSASGKSGYGLGDIENAFGGGGNQVESTRVQCNRFQVIEFT